MTVPKIAVIRRRQIFGMSKILSALSSSRNAATKKPALGKRTMYKTIAETKNMMSSGAWSS